MIISVFDRVENIVGKGENAGYQHFLLFQRCFKKASFSDTSKCVIVWEWVNPFRRQFRFLTILISRAFENFVRIEEMLVTTFSPLASHFRAPA